MALLGATTTPKKTTQKQVQLLSIAIDEQTLPDTLAL